MLVRHELFPTLVAQWPALYNPNECKELHHKILNDEQGRTHPTIKGSGVSSDDKVRNIISEFKLIDRIDPCIQWYLRQMSWNPAIGVTVKHSWYNIQENGSTLANHNHPNALLSGVLFVNVDASSSPFCVVNPAPLASFVFGKCATTAYNLEFDKFKPKVGDLFIFPSYLKHGSNGIVNETDKRSIISFNVEEV